jgi:CheY-like chemotaxis protein
MSASEKRAASEGDPRTTQRLREVDSRRRSVAMVVDDSEDAQEFLRAWLESEGFIVHQARNGREALEMLVELATPSLIVLDLLMPEMSGLELLDIITSYTRLSNVPLLVVTASDERVDLGNAPARHLRKPVDEEQLRQAAAELLVPRGETA